MFAEGSLSSVQRLLLVAALVSFGCQVDDRSLGFASSAGDLMDPEDGATSVGGSSGVAAPVGGSSGMAPTNVVGAAGSSGPVAGPGASNEQVVSPALTVAPGGACTPLGPPCSGSICIDAVCTLACDPLRPQTPRAPLGACAAGEGCSAGPEGSRCRVANAAAAAGASCAQDEDCASGLFCGESGQCRQYCIDSTDCSSGLCGLFREPRFAGELEVGFCSTGPCDPSNPQRPRENYGACAAGQVCRGTAAGDSYCEPAGTDGFHEPCSASSCAPGLFCGSGSLAGACSRYCLEDIDCPSGEVCELFNAPPILAGTLSVGFCASRCDPVHAESPTPPLTSCEAGFACNAADAGGSFCRRAGFGTLYSACATNVDCAAGYACGTVSDSCVALCFANEDCAIGACNPFSPLQFAGSLSVGSCAEICDPVHPQAPQAPLVACPGGFRCQAGNADGLSYCGRAGTLRTGATCTESRDCAPGHFCSSALTCVQYCYADADCDSGSCAEVAQSSLLAGTSSVFVCDP